jgi:hypothetical protein
MENIGQQNTWEREKKIALAMNNKSMMRRYNVEWTI